MSDIVSGTILAAEKIDDGAAVNLGTMERTRVIDAAREVLRYTGHNAEIELHPEMPTGPLNRVADNSLARMLLGWEPKVKFMDGLHQTIDWYFASKDREAISSNLEREAHRAGSTVHVAFFNRSFYPDTTATSQLLTDLCEDLVREHGCRVSVVAGVPLLPVTNAPHVEGGAEPRDAQRHRDPARQGHTLFEEADSPAGSPTTSPTSCRRATPGCASTGPTSSSP